MKKLGALFLAICMMISVLAVPAFAEGEIVINAKDDVISFYDNGMNGGNGSLETLNGYLMLRQCGEWTAYDISALTAGTYTVSVSYKSTAAVVWKTVGLDFVVDDGLELRSYLNQTGSAWNTELGTATAGKIYVPEGAKELKVKNHGMYPINLAEITLAYAGADDTSEDIKIFGQNATSSPNETKTAAQHYLGVDYWDAATGTDETYTQEDSEGNMHLPFTSGKILETTKLVQHTGDWARYDISDFKAGTYEVTLNRAHKANATYNLKIDGAEALSAAIEKTADSYGTYADAVLGKIYISDSAQYLTLENKGSGSVYVDYMTFNYISEERDESTYPSLTVSATNVISGGQGVGYYANSMNNTYAGQLETSGTNVVLRQAGEWAAYDVSSLEAGIYTLNLSYTVRESSGFYLDIYVDGELQAKAMPPKTTNSLGGTPDTNAICEVELKADSQVLKIRNSSSCVTFVSAIGLEYKGAERETAYKVRQYGDHATRTDVSNVITFESGVDYYDAGGKAFTSCLENGILAQNAGDWARYDISGLKEGTYKVTLNYASIASAQMKFKVDGDILLMKDMAATDSSYGTYSDAVVGNMYIEKGAEYLILENVGAGSIYPKYIDLELISESQTAWPSIRIKGSKAIEYYDTSGADTLESAGGNAIILRQYEWAEYDVSELKTGTYSLSISNGSTSACKVKASVDGTPRIIVDTIETGAYGTYEDNYLGSVYIGEDTETVTIELTGAAATYLNEVVFDYMTDIDESVRNLNIASSDVYQPEGYAEEGVSYYDGGGEGKFELTSGYVVLREGDWVAYDAKALGLTEGVYSVYVTAQAGSASALDIEAEGTGKVRSATMATSGDIKGEFEIGKLIVGANSNYFKISNNSTVRVILGNIRITDAAESTEIDFSSDDKGTASIISLKDLTSAYANVSLVRPNAKTAIGETVYIALYENGKLISVQMDTVTDAYEYSKSYLIEGINANSTVKVFVWDNVNAPVSEETEINAQ